MADNQNANSFEVNPHIEINMGGGSLPVGDGTTLGFLITWLRDLEGRFSDIKGIVDNSTNLATTDDINALRDEFDKKLKNQLTTVKGLITKKINESSSEDTKKALGLINDAVDSLEKRVGELDNRIGVHDKQLEGIFSKLDNVLNRLDKIEEALKGRETPVIINPEPTPEDKDINIKITFINEHGDDDLKKDVADLKDRISALEKKYGEDISKILAKDNEQDEEIKALKDKLKELDDKYDTLKKQVEDHEKRISELEKDPQPVPPPVPEPVPEPEPVPGPDPDKKKLKKAKFLTKAMQETVILAEPKRPWYKRLAKFAINHPILTALIGGGIGLGLTAAACGVTAAAGLTAMLSYASFFIPSLAIGTAAGAIAGGVVSGVSRLFPFGRRERLYTKFAKKYNQAMTIDKTKDLFAVLEQKHKEDRKLAREKQRSGNRFVKRLGVYKAAMGYHKIMEKTSRKTKRWLGKIFTSHVNEALETKVKLNLAEEKNKGKTMAIAGYLQKKRKLEAKLAAGKIDEEEFEEELQDLEEDVQDLKGGEPGISEVTNQMTYDKEALTLIEKVKSKNRTKAMNDLAKNIKRRNSKEVSQIVERVYEDPEDVMKKIAKLEKEGKPEEALNLKVQLQQLLKERKDYEDWARANGLEVEAPEDFVPEEEKEK